MNPGMDLAHVTNGRDGRGQEWTLCGLPVSHDDWQDQVDARNADRWCPECVDKDC